MAPICDDLTRCDPIHAPSLASRSHVARTTSRASRWGFAALNALMFLLDLLLFGVATSLLQLGLS
jgi:hypothetical protein